MKLLYEPPKVDEAAVSDLILTPLGEEQESSFGRKAQEAGREKKVALKELEDESTRKQRLEEKLKRDRLLLEAEETLRKSVERSGLILEEARKQGDALMEEAKQHGYEEGFARGQEEGRQQAQAEGSAVWQKKLDDFQNQIEDYVRQMDYARDKVLDEYLEELKDISLAAAEKIIKTSLKEDGEVAKRMILAATEKLKKKSWVKIYVGKGTQERKLNGDKELLEELSRISDNVKIVMMDEAEEGTCIVEMPDEIIDASVSTQMENIKDILNNARL